MPDLFSKTKKTRTHKTRVRKQSATRNSVSATKVAKSEKLRLAKSLIISTSILIAVAASVLPYMWIEKNVQPERDLMPIRVLEIEGKLVQVTREQIIDKLTRESVPVDDTVVIKKELSDSNNNNKKGVIGYFGSDLQQLEQRLQEIPWVQTIKLRRVWPDRLRIEIKEHRAIAIWNSEKLINEYGELFSPAEISGFGNLPELSGPDQQLQKLLVTFQELQQLLTGIELQLKVLNLNHRYSWSLVLSNGIKLQVGRKNLIERVERFIALYPLLQRESKLAIEKIDLRYDTGLAVTRLETTERQASL